MAKKKGGGKAKPKGARKGGGGGGGGAGGGSKQRPPAAAKPEPRAPNPYDVFQNRRRRRAVLGERVRGEKRNVARSRALSAKERTSGLLKETLTLSRRSKFRDNRLGAAMPPGDGSEAQDPRVLQRFVKLRQREARRTFNLEGAPSEELTVGGRPLSSLADEELRKAGGDGSDDDGELDLTGGLDDAVARSKEKKAELAREKQEQEGLLGKLDEAYGDIMGELQFRAPKVLAKGKSEADNYDQLVRTLGLERKATATDRLKTPEELARERAEKLEALERARVARTEGIMEVAEDAAVGPAAPKVEDGDGEAEEDEEEEEEEEGDEEEGESEAAEEGKAEDGAEEEGAEEDEDDDDRLGAGPPELLPAKAVEEMDIMANGPGEEDLPFAPECPGSVRAVEALLAGRSPATAAKLVQRVRARTPAALGVENKAKLKAFFLALLEFCLRVMVREDGDLSARGVTIAYALRRPLVELAVEHPNEAQAFFAPRVLAMAKVSLPKAAEFCCLKLIALLFPVTDFQHPVCTPAAILADEWASKLAALGAEIAELVSEGTLLFEVLYQMVLPARRFCTSFFQLGSALLESCWASAGAGRLECIGAAGAIAGLLAQALRQLQEADSVVAHVASQELLAPTVQRLADSELCKGPNGEKAREVVEQLQKLCADLRSGGLVPLRLFQTERPQIKTLDPIFHEVGDRPSRGMEMSETKQLQRRLNKERRAASRQLQRDAAVLQQLNSRKEQSVRTKRTRERARVRSLMDEERQMLKKLKTESGGGMDTSLKRYSAAKERKQANRRLGGNVTDDKRKEAGKKVREGSGGPDKQSRRKKGGGKKSGGKDAD